jgi:hypothetical protein
VCAPPNLRKAVGVTRSRANDVGVKTAPDAAERERRHRHGSNDRNENENDPEIPRTKRRIPAVGATIYFGSEESSRQIVEVTRAFDLAHKVGLAVVLWCYVRNKAFKKDKDYDVSADLTGQANHLGVTIQADQTENSTGCNWPAAAKDSISMRKNTNPEYGRQPRRARCTLV